MIPGVGGFLYERMSNEWMSYQFNMINLVRSRCLPVGMARAEPLMASSRRDSIRRVFVPQPEKFKPLHRELNYRIMATPTDQTTNSTSASSPTPAPGPSPPASAPAMEQPKSDPEPQPQPPQQPQDQPQPQNASKPAKQAPKDQPADAGPGDEKLTPAELKKKAKAEKAARRVREKAEREAAGAGAAGGQPGTPGKKDAAAAAAAAGGGGAPGGGGGGKGQKGAPRRGSGQTVPQAGGSGGNAGVSGGEQKKKQEEKKVAVFGHLYGQQRRTTVAGAGKEVHPAVLALGLQMRDYVVCGSSARCVATLLAFKRVCLYSPWLVVLGGGC